MSKKKQVQTEPVEEKIAKKQLFRPGTIIIAVVIAALLATGGYFFYKYQQVANNPQAQLEERNNAETAEVIEQLSSILLVPEDSDPTVARVQDVEALKRTNESFYKDVAVDDYIVLYPDRAIIYRSSSDQVINVAPVVDTPVTTEEE